MKKAAIALLAIILLCALVYLFVFDSVALVMDSAWNQVLPTKTIFKLRCKLALEGQRLKLVKIDDGCLYNINELEQVLFKLKDDYVVLSPVVSNVVSSNNLNIGTLLGDSIVAAIGNVNQSLFDIVFVSDELSGWVSCAKTLATKTQSMSQNVALVYEKQSFNDIDAIINCFDTNRVSVFEYEKSRLFFSETLKKLDQQSMLFVMCLPFEDFSYFFESESANKIQWIVDYRYALAVPKGPYAVIMPNLPGLCKTLSKTKKGSCTKTELDYVYEVR